MTDFNSIRSAVGIQNAYGRAREMQGNQPSTPATGEAAKTSDFSQMVANAASEVAETVRNGDAVAMAGLNGQVGIQQVVEATMAMESTVRVSVALRDKLVEAYQEVMRMPV